MTTRDNNTARSIHPARSLRSWAALGAATVMVLAAAPLAGATTVPTNAPASVGVSDSAEGADKRRPSNKRSSKPAKRRSAPKANKSRSNRSSAKKGSGRNRSSANRSRSGGNKANRSRSSGSRSSANRSGGQRSRANTSRNRGSQRSATQGKSNRSKPGATRSGRRTQSATTRNAGKQRRSGAVDSRRPSAGKSSGHVSGKASGKASGKNAGKKIKAGQGRGGKAAATATRPDYRYSYDRAKARESKGKNKQNAKNRRHNKGTGDYDDRRPGRHKDAKHSGKNKKKNKGHKGYQDKSKKNYKNNHHNNNKKTVNNYYYGGYNHGYYRPSWRRSWYCPSYSIGYSSYNDGLSFSIGFGSSWNDWCAWPTYGYSSYTPSYGYGYGYGSTSVVVIDDDPEVVYVPVETTPYVPDLTVGWEHLATGREEEALRYFSTRVQEYGDSSVPKAGYALAAAQMNDHSRAVWSMRRAFRVDDGELGYLPLDTRLLNLAQLLESRYAFRAEESSGRDRRDALFMVASMRYILHEPEAALDAAYAARDSGDHDSSLKALIRQAEAELDY